MAKLSCVCPCLFGLESVVSHELSQLGAQGLMTENGRVFFEGTPETVARVNVGSRVAERVAIVLGRFRASSFQQLFEGVKELPLERFIGEKDAFPVKGWSLNSQLHSIPDCQSIIKKAAVERLKEKYGIGWFEETGPIHQLQFSILKDEVTLMLDTSGAGLHKRGYRANSLAAPIKETLAAGMIELARVRKDNLLLDPFCGSGTFLIEATLRARNIAPGINRTFAAEKWDEQFHTVFRQARSDAMDAVERNSDYAAVGYDVDPAAVELTMENAKKAGIRANVRASVQDIGSFQMPEEKATVITNPPYGERLLDIRTAEGLYRTMGRVFPRRKYASYYIISPHEEFERIFDRPADRRRKLYNGMLKCQVYMYFRD